MWDINSGCQVLRFTECHEKNEITAMNLDAAGRRLMTGSRGGDIKVRHNNSNNNNNNNNNNITITTTTQ